MVRRLMIPADASPMDRRKSKPGKAKALISIHPGSPIDPPRIHDSCQTAPADPHKAVVDALWDRLPTAVKAGIVAMVRAAVE